MSGISPVTAEIIQKKSDSPAWREYCRLMRERPDLFRHSDHLRIVTELEAICQFEAESGRTIGVCYSSPYSMMLVDLVEAEDGTRFAYERSIAAVEAGAVVTIPVHGDQFVLLRQYRHALREEQLAFPRGFGEPGISAAENAAKELGEELGAEVLSSVHIGGICSDSGHSGGQAEVFLCKITEPKLRPGYEGILSCLEVSVQELWHMIRVGEIRDGFTLSACALAVSRGLLADDSGIQKQFPV